MSDLTNGQKARLGLFLLVAVGLLAVIVIIKVGQTLFDHRDVYHVRMPGNVGSLDPGSGVTFNGITVGRVDRVAVDALDVSVVAVDLSLTAGTPVPEDAKATVAMRGITGLKYVEITGGTNKARRRTPGEEIPAGRSTLDEIQDRAINIAAKLDGLLDDARAFMYGPSTDHIEATLASVRRSTEGIEDLLLVSAPRVASVIERGDEALAELTALLADTRKAVAVVRETAVAARDTMRSVDKTVASVGDSVSTAARELTPLAQQLTKTIGRAGLDVRAALDELAQGFNSVGALADMLRADPSSIILGKSGPPRELP